MHFDITSEEIQTLRRFVKIEVCGILPGELVFILGTGEPMIATEYLKGSWTKLVLEIIRDWWFSEDNTGENQETFGSILEQLGGITEIQILNGEAEVKQYNDEIWALPTSFHPGCFIRCFLEGIAEIEGMNEYEG